MSRKVSATKTVELRENNTCNVYGVDFQNNVESIQQTFIAESCAYVATHTAFDSAINTAETVELYKKANMHLRRMKVLATLLGGTPIENLIDTGQPCESSTKPEPVRSIRKSGRTRTS